MNEVIKYGSVQGNPLYNCSALTPSNWTQRDGVPRPVLGISEAFLGSIVDIIYIPMVTVMLQKEHFKMSCYKIMVLLAIVDTLSIVIDCLITGFLAYQGAVFCTYPEFIYVAGSCGKGLWCCSCVIALILVTNRLLDLLFPKARIFFFEGHRTFLVLLFPIFYALYFVFFNTPILFTSKYHSWFFDPMIFEGWGADYENVPILFNNFLVVFITCFLYVVFCFVLGAKVKNVATGSESRNASIQIFFQSAMICAVNLLASMVYVAMNYINVPLWVIMMGQFNWQLGNAAPVFIYLKFNKTIRNGTLRLLGIKKPVVIDSTRRLTKSNISTSVVHTIS